jgi:hypothetical protein
MSRGKNHNTNTAQITALDSSNNTKICLVCYLHWTWKNISELCHQELHPAETSPTRMPIRRTTGPTHVPFRQVKRTRAIMECQHTNNHLNHAQPLNIANNHQYTLAPPHANAQEIRPPTNLKRRFVYIEQASDEEEGTGNELCPSYNNHSIDVLWH